MRVFLTGGTGLLGSHVADQLRARGDEVTALVRPSSDTAHLEAAGCELVEGDVLDPVESLADAMRGADAVIHGAAKVFQRGKRAEFRRVNVTGTYRVVEAAARVAPRVIHLSSVAVYAGLSMDEPLTEDRWTEADPKHQAPYAQSKHLAERGAWSVHDEGRIRLTTARPCVVYGERDRAAAPIIFRSAGRRVAPLPGGGRTTLPLVYAGNVARGVLAALDRDASVGRAYNLAMDVPITARRLLSLAGRELGRQPWIVPVPARLARAGARAADVFTGVVPFFRTLDARRAMRGLTTDNPYDSSRARLELGWSGHVAHEEGIRRTAVWWKSR